MTYPVVLGAFVQLGGTLGVEVLSKATALFLFGLVLTHLARRRPAYVRSLMLAASLSGALVLPLIVATAPRVFLNVPVQTHVAEPSVLNEPFTEQELDWQKPGAVAANFGRTRWSTLVSHWSAVLLLTLVSRSVFMLFRVGVDLWRLGRLRREGIPSLRLDEQLQALARCSGVNRQVDLRVHSGISGPLTCGFFFPVILLPEDAESWSDQELCRAFVHELEHVRRADWIVQMMAQLTCSLYWFHPLVWMLSRRLSLECECACDDAVLEHEESTAYAQQLVSVARRLRNSAAEPAIGMARRRSVGASSCAT
jgi:beta-lactamase regulating signal transducer with metallopeptidase domain